MPGAPVIEPTAIDREMEEIAADPEVRASLEALDDPQDREDLLDALIIRKRIAERKERTHSLQEVKKKLGL
ncbi:MAG: hypothetical protein V1792_13035 [Pseudomonadota bacterium]